MAMVMIFTLLPTTAFAAAESNDDVEIDKTAVRTGADTWEVTMKVTAKEREIKPEPLELVLVMDTSGSMAWCTHAGHNHDDQDGGEWCDYPKEKEDENSRIVIAGKAAQKLVDDLQKDGVNASVSVVSFSGYYTLFTQSFVGTAKVKQSLIKLNSGSLETIKDRIPHEFSDADGGTGMNKGLEVGSKQFSGKTTNKVIVLLADGDCDGTDPLGKDGCVSNLKSAGIKVHTIGFTTSNTTLKQIASKTGGKYYQANDVDSLAGAFKQIATSLKAMITDPLGDNVEVDGEPVASDGGTATVTNGILKWNPKDGKLDAGKTNTITYTVKLKDSAIKVGTENIALNGQAVLSYEVGESSETKTLDFPIPTDTLEVGQLTTKVLLDGKEDSSTTGDKVIVYKNNQFTWTQPSETIPKGDVTYTYSGSTYDGGDTTATSAPVTAGAHTLVHKYTSTKYKVTYNGNGATSGTAPVDSKEYAYNAEVTVCGNTGSLVKTNYSFAGWNTQADGKGTTYATGNTFNITKNTTLYAQWTKNPVPGLIVTKTLPESAPTEVKIGDTITWNITVTNSGETDLTGITLTDNLTGAAAATSSATLYAVNNGVKDPTPWTGTFDLDQRDSKSFVAEYLVKEADAGKTITNTATATASDSTTHTSNPIPGVKVENANPNVSVVKTADKDKAKLDDTITYTVKVTNTGNVTLTDLYLSDMKWSYPTQAITVNGESGTAQNGSYKIAELEPEQVVEIQYSYAVTANDVAYGKVENSATVTGTDLPDSVTGSKTVTVEEPPKATAPVYVNVYHNGDTSKPAVSKFLGNYAKGTPFKNILEEAGYLTSLDNLYTKASGSAGYEWNQVWSHEISNWPASIGEGKVNGWTNLCTMVYDRYPVVVKAVYDGDKANAITIHSGTALKGTDLNDYLNKNVTNLEKAGYDLDQWFNWDWYGHKIANNATVNGWTNVYVTYTSKERFANVYFNVDPNKGSFPDYEPSTTVKFENIPEFSNQQFQIPTVEAKEGYRFVGWKGQGADVFEWDADATTFGVPGLCYFQEGDINGYAAIEAVFEKIVEPTNKTLKIFWAIDNDAGAEWTTYDNSDDWTETIAWSDKDNTFVIPGLTVKDGYKLAGWSVSGKEANYWDAETKTFGLTGLIVEDENGGYVSITANIVKDEPPVDPDAGKTLKIYWAIDNPDGAEWTTYGNGNAWTETIAWSDKDNTFVIPGLTVKGGYKLAGWSVSGKDANYWDAGTKTFGLTGLIVEDENGGYVSITANIVKDETPEDNNGSGGGGTTHTYTLKYETNGGKKIDSESKRSEWTKDYENLPVPTRSGYAFTGWYSDKKLTKLITDDVKVNTSVVTIYAGWRKSSVPAMLNGDDHFAYIQGYADGTVHPDNNITRAQVATIFFRLLDEDVRDDSLTTYNTFTDVSADYWANTAISTMSELGVIQGYSDGTFRPNAFITRAQFAAICARFDDTVKRGSSDFTDIDGHWAEAEIERAATLGWIQGYSDGTFRPNNNITRAQAMTMINRVLCRLPEDEDDLLRGMNTWTDCNPGDWCYLAVQEATNSHDFQHRGVYESWTDLNRDPDWSKYEN